MTLVSLTASAQFGGFGGRGQGNPWVPSEAAISEDFKPALSNQDSKQYPMVNSARQVRAQISAPEATKVGLDIAGKIYTMTKDENGVWTGTSAPQDPGFHYYQLNIDGASVPDPTSLYYYGASRWGSGIELPSDDQDFWQVKRCSTTHPTQSRCVVASSICPTSTTPTPPRSSQFSICSMVWVRTSTAGHIRVTQPKSWTTSSQRRKPFLASS